MREFVFELELTISLFSYSSFQYKATRLEADQIYENSMDELQEKATVFVATDHQEKPFFKPLADHYDLVFLKDFKEELKGVNTNCEYTSFYQF